MGHRPFVSDLTTRRNEAGYPRKPRQRNHNDYSDEDKAKGLVVATLVGSHRASQWLPIPQQTLSDWLHGRGINNEVYRMARDFAEELGAKLEGIANLIAGDMPNKVANAGLKDQAIALGVVVDKRQLLNNLPTAINETSALTNEDRATRIKELMARAKDRSHDTE